MTSLSIIVRWSGEKTLPMTLASIEPRKSGETIYVLNNVGNRFYRVLEQSFELCSSLPVTHTLILDADIVLFRTGMQLIRKYVARNPGFFRIEFQRICKFTNIPKGIHLYNNKRLKLFGRDYLCSMPSELKPESATIRRIYEAEHTFVQCTGPVVGWHDYRQSPQHIREKMTMRALRNPELYDLLVQRQQLNPFDLDFVFAIQGFEFGLERGWEALPAARN